MLFESSGGQLDRVAHLPELRFALGEPEVETTTVDNAAAALEQVGFFIRKAGADGYRIHHQATLRKAVADLRASLDEETEVKPAIQQLIQREFAKGSEIPKVYFPEDSSAVNDDPRMTLVVMNPDEEWREDNHVAQRIIQWTRERGRSPRLYPAALVWCCRRPRPGPPGPGGTLACLAEGQERDRRRQHGPGVREVRAQRSSPADPERRTRGGGGSPRQLLVHIPPGHPGGAGTQDHRPGSGHSGSTETPSARVVNTLRREELLNESVGAGYLDRNWPPALSESGAWPLSSLRQSFLNGSLTRLLDPDRVLRQKVQEFVEKGDFGLASGEKEPGTFNRFWYRQPVSADEVRFDSDTFLITRARAEQMLAPPQPAPEPEPEHSPDPQPSPEPGPTPPVGSQQPLPATPQRTTLRLRGTVQPESWNMVGRRILTKLQQGEKLNIEVNLTVEVDPTLLPSLKADIQQALEDLKLTEQVRME